MGEFKKGDLVKPAPRAFEEFPENNFGNEEGVVVWDDGDGWYDYKVQWAGGGNRYYYRDEHLEAVAISLENE